MLAVLLLVLGRWRLALIPGIAVPVALIGSLTVVRLSGSNLNSLILFGLVLATGIVVDDAIVVSDCLLYTSPSPRDGLLSRMPSSA